MHKSLSYLAIAAAFTIPLTSFAAEYRIGQEPSVPSSEHVTGNLYIAGGSVTDTGAVSGDVTAVGGNTLMSGDIAGDVLTAGGNLTLLSNVGGDIRAAGGNIVIQGKVGGDVIVGGGQVTIEGPGVTGDVVVGGGNIRIDAPIAGNLKAGGGNVYINAPVKGTITVNANKVTLGPSAVLYGALSYTSPSELTKESGADVRSEVHYTARASGKPSPALVAGLISAGLFAKFLVLLVCALIFGFIFRRYSHEAATRAIERTLPELGRGLLTVIVLPIISVLLFVTVLGTPFGILGIISFVALMIFSWIVAPIIIGSSLYRYLSKGEVEVSWKSILLGVVVFELLGLVPFVGWLVQAATVLVSVGVVSEIKTQVVKEWR